MGIRAIARYGLFGNSKNVGISSGTKDDENAVDSGLLESEVLGGCTMKPAWFNRDGDHC